jgi:hypothetical protein
MGQGRFARTSATRRLPHAHGRVLRGASDAGLDTIAERRADARVKQQVVADFTSEASRHATRPRGSSHDAFARRSARGSPRGPRLILCLDAEAFDDFTSA